MRATRSSAVVPDVDVDKERISLGVKQLCRRPLREEAATSVTRWS